MAWASENDSKISSYQSLEEILKNCPKDVKDKFQAKTYNEGEIICQQGSYYNYFYIILSGRASISIIGENGRKYNQAIYEKDNFFGELEIFNKKPYIASIEALTKVELTRLPREDFIKWLKSDVEFAMYLTEQICEAYYELSAMAGMNTLYPLKYRICRYIVLNKPEHSDEVDFNKTEMTELFAVTNRSINRTLKELADDGIIQLKDDSVRILNYNDLLQEKKKNKYL